MRTLKLIGTASLAALAGCGLESTFGNAFHSDYPRPASAIDGTGPVGGTPAFFSALDSGGNAITAFLTNVDAKTGVYDMHLPSSKYSMLRARFRGGNMELRAWVPSIGEESVVTGIDLNSRNVTEALVVESWLSAHGIKLTQLSPAAYLGTQAQIRAAMDGPTSKDPTGQTLALRKMVERVMKVYDPAVSQSDTDFFGVPVLDASYAVKTSPLANTGFLTRDRVDIDGDGIVDDTSDLFDAQLSKVAPLFDPTGCPSTDKIRVVFTANFNQGTLNGNCGPIDRFKWATDKPGKKMYFVGWIHKDSKIQDPVVNNLIGGSTPNNLVMYDDGTNGDEVAGDNIWTIAFDLPRGQPGAYLRIGYKYTWGTRGAPWTGSEEWPGNSRILEIVDRNDYDPVTNPFGLKADNIVYRRDAFGDEATNKDNSNLSISPKNTGSITWSTDLRGYGPEAWEQMVDINNDCKPSSYRQITPQSVGPIKVACPGQ